MKNEQRIRFRPMMITVFLGSFAVMLSSSTINIAVPYLMKHFNTDLDTVRWTITGFMLSMGTTAPIAAFLGERYSYKGLYLASIAGFASASFLVVFPGSIHLLIAIRILQGFFGGVTVPASMAMIYQAIPREKQVTAITVWSIAPTLAPAVGPTLSGFLIQYLGWKAIFLINIPLGLIAVVMGFVYMPYYRLGAKEPLDIPGILLALLTSTALLVSFSEGAAWGWNSPAILFLLIGGGLFMAAFIGWELHAPSPVLDLRVFRHSKFLFGVVASCVINIALYSGTFMTPLFLQGIQRVTPLNSALILLPATATMALVMPIVGALYKRVGTAPLLVVGILLVAAGTWRMSHLSVTTSHGYVKSWMALRYLGLAIATMPASYAGMSSLPKNDAGHGSSLINWAKQMVACLSIGIFTSLLSARAALHCGALLASGTKMGAQAVRATGYVMGINDVYTISCIITLAALPFGFFLRKGKGCERMRGPMGTTVNK